ncbi:hypothetical protein [Paenibacillus ginsengarvi]|uniref:hypothetical protein n=1 Tax=Paenibacillus ginsengarvi TaxID=400777 RepID=UPI001873F37B|nr:hypothetical protein [Paenibacillus ginsengarvi]
MNEKWVWTIERAASATESSRRSAKPGGGTLYGLTPTFSANALYYNCSTKQKPRTNRNREWMEAAEKT